MSIEERNRYLEILHRNGNSRRDISKIMKDIDGSGIFADADNFDEEDYGALESASDIIFSRKTTKEEKIGAIKSLKNTPPVSYSMQNTKKVSVPEEIILAKRKELIEAGVIKENDEWEDEEEKDKGDNRYGRTDLHEAIAYRNLDFVKKCIKQKKYLDSKDNNGCTPREMAYNEGWEEGFELLNSVE